MTTKTTAMASVGQPTMPPAMPSDTPPPIPSLESLNAIVQRENARRVGAGPALPPRPPRPPLAEIQRLQAETDRSRAASAPASEPKPAPARARAMSADEIAALKTKQAEMAKRMEHIAAMQQAKTVPVASLTGLLSHVVRGKRQPINGIDN